MRSSPVLFGLVAWLSCKQIIHFRSSILFREDILMESRWLFDCEQLASLALLKPRDCRTPTKEFSQSHLLVKV